MVRKPKLCCFISVPRNRQNYIEETQKGNWCKVGNFMLFYDVSDSFLESFVGISRYFYDFIKCFNVSLHLGLLHYHDIGTYIGMKIHGSVLSKWFMVWLRCKKDMELLQTIFKGGEVFMWCYRHYNLTYCFCGTVGPWLKGPKALKEDTPMWVYGVGPIPGF